MATLYPDFDNVQSDGWGWGVFYATDSNSVDQRCRYLEDPGNGYGPIYDCPKGKSVLVSDGSIYDNLFGTDSGSGNYEVRRVQSF